MREKREIALCAFIAALAGWVYFATACPQPGSWFSRQPGGYYGGLTAGFQSGHLYADIEPHPALLALKNPYDPVANAPYRVHDLSLYRGHYYLYYGVTPVLILFWPVKAVTGLYPTEPFAVALFCTAATALGIALLLAVRRRHFPGAPAWALASSALVLAFANPMLLLLAGPQFYQVPITCAIFLQMAIAGALYRALHSVRRQLAWLAAAGLLFGLAIGARPNYLLSFAGPLVVALALALREEAGRRRAWAVFRNVAVVSLPAGICGAGLLLYNWLRYGSVSEFGIRYQLGGESFFNLQTLQLRVIPMHLRAYLFAPGIWQAYFPFFGARTWQPYGFLRYVAWGWLAMAALLPARAEEPGQRRGRTAILLAVFAATLANLALLCSFFATSERYPGDFASGWLLLSGVGALALSQRAVSMRARVGVGCLLASGAVAGLCFNLGVFLKHLPQEGWLLDVARVGNIPVYAWDRAQGRGLGSLRLELELPAGRPDRPEPLFGTGSESGRYDWLQIEFPAPGRARLSFFHAGWGLLHGREFSIPADRRIVVETRCGSLLPPFGFPTFFGWQRSEYDALRRELTVKVDGAEVLSAALEPYDSSPGDLTIGGLRWPPDELARRFSGRILGSSRLPLAAGRPPVPVLPDRTPVALTLHLPVLHGPFADPILATGQGRKSDLLYCRFDGKGRICFGLDHFGSGGPQSGWIRYDPLQPHVLTVWMGSLGDPVSGRPVAPAIPWSHRLLVLFDGQPMLNGEQVFYPAFPGAITFGRNAFGSSTAVPEFSGLLVGVRPVGFAGLPAPDQLGQFGPVEMAVRFPANALGTSEPLVVTGVSGAGDMIYVRYLDPGHIGIRFDHWGVGGITGPPFKVDYLAVHRLDIVMGSLFPPGEGSNRVRVTIDGAVALEGESPCHPSEARQIRIGENTIGGSTCGPAFTGRILSVDRTAVPPQ